MSSYYSRPRCLEHTELLDPSSIVAPCSGPKRNPKPRRSSTPPYIHPRYAVSPCSSPALADRPLAIDSSDSSSEGGTPPPDPPAPSRVRFIKRVTTPGRSPAPESRPTMRPRGHQERTQTPSTDGNESEYSLNVPDHDWPEDATDQANNHEAALDELDDWDSLPKIPKPEGEAGRPKRGGYDLEEKLGWDDKLLSQVKSFVKSQVISKLKCSIPFTSQQSDKLEEIRSSSIGKFPRLKQYEDCWVVDDLIRCNLKYQKQKIAKEQNEAMAARYRATDEAREERRALEQVATSSRKKRET
ncbi:hypothetical protein V5O48_009788 [Marasmius crinis-equi]|uniref:Uncharacterized protein n=1 Tax=Marasmius crinis-equi TaxID=585013 RepID=A0ABR3FAA4_9AGAR